MLANKILIIEDNLGDVLLLKEELLYIGYSESEIHHCISLSCLSDNSLTDFSPTFIFADLALEQSGGLETFLEIYQHFPWVPIVVLTGYDDEKTALECIKAGAQDYLIKGRLSGEKLYKTIVFATERNQLKQQIASLKNDYERIFNQNPLPCFIVDKATSKILNVNKAATHLYGYTKKELCALNLSDLVTPGEGGPPSHRASKYNTHCKKDGELLYVELATSSIEYSGRNSYLVMANDITQQIKVEEEKTNVNLRLQAIFNGTRDAILLADKRGIYVQSNPAAEAMLGYSSEELLGLKMTDVVERVLPDGKAFKSWSSFLSAGHQAGLLELKRKDGKFITCHYNAAANILPGLHLSILTDITERENARKEIEAKSKQIEDILESITDCFFTVDNNWTVQYWNKATEQLLGRKREDIIGRNLWDVYDDATDLKLYKEYYKAMEEQVPVHFEDFYAPLSIWLEISAYPSKEGLTVYFKDITKGKKHSLEILQTRNNQATLINSCKDRIWSVSRDLKLIAANTAYKNYFKNVTGVEPREGEDVLDDRFGGREVLQWRSFYERALTGDAFRADYDYYNPRSKKTESTEVSFDPIFAVASQDVIGCACYSRNITERKEREQLIKNQNAKLHASGQYLEKVLRNLKKIMDSSLDVICAIDNRGRFAQVSAASTNVWGYSPAELIGKNYIDYVYSEDVKATDDVAGKIKNGTNVTNFENRFIHKNGEFIPMIWSSRWDDEQQTMFSVGKDATAIKEAETAKSESERRFTALAENTNDVITIMDKSFNYVYESPSIKKMLGYGPLERIGKNAAEYIHLLDVKKAIATVRSLEEGEFKSVTYRFKHANGEWRWIEACISRQLDNPAIKGFVVNKRDVTERKRNELLIKEQNAKLKENEQSLEILSRKLSKIMDSSLDVICSFNEDGEFAQVSAACKELWGYNPTELLGTRYIDYVDGRCREATEKASRDIMSGIDMRNFENLYVHKSGYSVPVLWSAHWDDKEKMMYCIAKDATALKEAERVKAETERKLTALLQKGADTVSILDADGNYLFVSPNVEQVFGFSHKELVGKNAFQLIHPEDIEITRRQLQVLLESGEIKKATIRFKDGSNNWRWVEIVGTNLLNDPAIRGIVINSRDITERKMREEELRAANERFEIVLKATNEVIYDWDLVSGELSWNKNFATVFGYKNVGVEKDLAFWKQHVHPDDVDRVMNSLNETIRRAGSRKWRAEYRFIKANGEVANVLEQGYLIVDENNTPIRFVGSMQDITERKKKETERELIIKELTKSNNDLKQFSFITSHNLRAPLSNILGLLNILDYEALNKDNAEMLQMIDKSARQLKQTIEDLSRILIIKNNVDIDLGELNIQEVLNEVSAPFFNSLNDIAAEIFVDLKEDTVVFNKTYLESIFINLISNAIKYRSGARKLCIHISTDLNAASETVLTFSDNGIGFNMEQYKDRLCGLYQRFHDNVEGQGIGLFIIKSQITALGGSLDIASRVNGGTTFTITFKNNSHLKHIKTDAFNYASGKAILTN